MSFWFENFEARDVRLLPPPFKVKRSASTWWVLDAWEQLSEDSTYSASSLMIELDEKFVRKGHLFKISSVVLSSKQRSKKFVNLDEIPSFQ